LTCKKKDNFTPLHYTAHYGNLEATNILVDRGAAINSTDDHFNTPLDLALNIDKFEVFLYMKVICVDANS
jgi:ankyrin repeat protein